MSNSDLAFKKVWLIALEKSKAEGVFSGDLPTMKKEREETNNKKSLSSLRPVLTSLDPDIGHGNISDSNSSGSNTDSSNISGSGELSSAETLQADEDPFAGMAGDKKFHRWKAEMIHKLAMRRAHVVKREFHIGSQVPRPKSDTFYPPNASRARHSAQITKNGATSYTDVICPTCGRGSFGSAGLLSYIQSRESNLLFSASRTPARHSSEVRGPVRWMKVNLGDYSTFKLASDRFENSERSRSLDPVLC